MTNLTSLSAAEPAADQDVEAAAPSPPAGKAEEPGASQTPWRGTLLGRLTFAILLVGLGDVLFFDRSLGISIAIFLIALAAAAFLANGRHASQREALHASAMLAVGLLPLVEGVTVISLGFGIAGIVAFAVTISGGFRRGIGVAGEAAIGLLVAGPFQLLPDLIRAKQRARERRGTRVRGSGIVGWIVPLVFGALFANLFASANPLVERWFEIIDPSRVDLRLNPWRIALWAALISLAWPLIAVRLRYWLPRLPPEPALPPASPPAAPASPPVAAELFGAAAILRSLVLFNVMFAVQSVLDGLFLWVGVALPDGMTYATYAHRGAYPLIVTALLAAGFVLAAMRRGGPGERSPLIRVLVFVWIGQNVLLVGSSILRLDLYVAVYSLTELRVAAFVWMILVAIGLVLIIVRIASGRSNAWLVGANLASLLVVLYACAFVNVPHVIASYNLAHSATRMPGAQPFDAAYALSLGRHAVPAVDRFVAEGGIVAPYLRKSRDALAAEHLERMRDWRAFGGRDWRLVSRF